MKCDTVKDIKVEDENVECDDNANEQDEEKDTLESSKLSIKHKLRDKWNLWLLCPIIAKKKKKPFKSLDTFVYGVTTVEDFWAIYNNLKIPSKILFESEKTNIIFTKDPIQPAWEDPYNQNGGEWNSVITFTNIDLQKNYDSLEYAINKFWETLLLTIIGGTFDGYESVSSIWLCVRPPSTVRILVWTLDTENDNVLTVGNSIAKVAKQSNLEDVQGTFTTHYDQLLSVTDREKPVPILYRYTYDKEPCINDLLSAVEKD
uniref:Eukaryotic translation initiation factor 4E n=2 Tax=Lygus hesperus TaxID=30085 RepID=A0A0A9Z3H1_LYGHE